MWLLIPILLYSLVFFSVRHVYSYWHRKGFPNEKSSLTWPFLKQIYKREFHYVDAVCEAYKAGKERCLGIYFLFHPTLLIRDLSLAQDIMDNPSGHFNDSKWDNVRGYRKFNTMEKISPIFSAARLRDVFGSVEKVGDIAVNHLNVTITSAKCNPSLEIDMPQLLRTYSANIIANLIYGLQIDLFKQTDSVFQQYLNNSVRPSVVNSYTYNRIPKKSSLNYRLRDIIRENVEEREGGGVIREDILQALVKFRNGNDIECKDTFNWRIDNLCDREKLLSVNKLADITEHLLENGMAAMASTGVFALYEILQQPQLKTKILDEINTHLQINDKQPQLSYESLKQLKLMDLCIQETLRKYPNVAIIECFCRKDFPIPDTKHTLREGKSLMIPILAIQRDEKYFEDPLCFKPQRFVSDSNGNRGNRLLSLGLGVKTCLAQNFFKLVVKCILVKLFFNFHMEPVEAEKLEICYNRTPFIQSKEGFKVKLKTTKINFS